MLTGKPCSFPSLVESLLVVCIIMLLGLTHAACSGSDAQTSDLSLSIDARRTRLLLGEPMYLNAVIANHGTTMARVVPLLSPESGRLTYWIRSPSGAVRDYEPLCQSLEWAHAIALYPGEEIGGTYMVLWGMGGYTFPTPGEYAITATFLDGLNSLCSEALRVEVLDPSGEDADALPFIFDDEVAEFLGVPDYQHQRAASLVQELLNRYPGSSYAPYAAYVLALRASKDGAFYPGGDQTTIRVPPDYGAAIAGFQRLVREWPDSVLSDDAQFELARTYRDMGDMPAAGEHDDYTACNGLITDTIYIWCAQSCDGDRVLCSDHQTIKVAGWPVSGFFWTNDMTFYDGGGPTDQNPPYCPYIDLAGRNCPSCQ